MSPESAEARPEPSLEAEALLLREAHAALAGGDGDRSLRLLDEHARRFPSSVLEPERAADRVFAMCQLKDLDGARVAAVAFIARYPEGPLAARVRASCGASTSPR